MRSDFPGMIPTIYSPEMYNNRVIVRGSNFISLGINPAWRFEISTATNPVPRESYTGDDNYYATMIVEVLTTNSDSKLTITPQFIDRTARYGMSNKYVQSMFWQKIFLKRISGDLLFNHIEISLNVPDGLNMDESPDYDSYTNTVDKAVQTLIGAQDEIFSLKPK
jgi:hypothetical protein